MWKIKFTPEFECWWDDLDPADQARLSQRIGQLKEQGPGLGRPAVDTIRDSSVPNMKELRAAKSLRVLFVFDPQRVAVLLIGGDKAGQWNGWYPATIREAERLYQRHLDELDEGGQK